ncbi:fimbrillin family protein [Phocaeicola sp.]
MKKRNFFNILFGGLLLAGAFLVSCSNDDSEENSTSGGTRIVKFDLTEGYQDEVDEEARALAEKPDTIRQRFDDGMEAEVVVEQDKSANSRFLYPINSGVKVLAIVINNNTNKVYRIQQLEVKDGALECEVPDYDVRIVFYSYNSTTKMPTTTLTPGDPATIDTKDNNETYKEDVMWAKTNVIKPSSNNLGGVTFKHLHTRIMLILYYYPEYSLQYYKVSLQGSSIRQYSSVRIIPGMMIPKSLGGIIVFEGTSTVGPTTAISSPFYLMVPSGEEEKCSLTIANINGNPVFEHTMDIYKKFEAGKSYAIHFTVTKSDIIWRWTNKYTQWDASVYYTPGVPPVEGEGSYYNKGSVAENLCKYCPTADEVLYMIGAGNIYWDDNGPEWKASIGSTVYKTGIWVKKKKYWTTMGSSTVPISPTPNSVKTSGEYMFLPASGMLDASYSQGFNYLGKRGYYWTRSKFGDSEAYHLYFSQGLVGLQHSDRSMGCSLWAFWE